MVDTAAPHAKAAIKRSVRSIRPHWQSHQWADWAGRALCGIAVGNATRRLKTQRMGVDATAVLRRWKPPLTCAPGFQIRNVNRSVLLVGVWIMMESAKHVAHAVDGQNQFRIIRIHLKLGSEA
jgi:hypothetical protein